MKAVKNKLKDGDENQLISKLADILFGIQNGSICIVKQDSIIVQINTYEKISLQ